MVNNKRLNPLQSDPVRHFFRSHGEFPVLLICGAIIVFVQVLLPVFAPEQNTPTVIALCAAAQFFIAIFAGVAWSKSEAIREANTRWVPMAASACDRLATILGSVVSLRATVSQACSAASKNLPELSEAKNRAVRIHFEGLCGSNATRLIDVESHLDSALTDWERFIRHNCTGPECADIGRRLATLRSRLSASAIGAASSACQTAEGLLHPDVRPEEVAGELDLIVSGVTPNGSHNGRWPLRKVEEGFWECDKYVLRKESSGWYVEDKADSNSYFFRIGTEGQYGVYERCEVCPHDGIAAVFRNMAGPKDELRAEPNSDTSPAPANSAVVNIAVSLDHYLQHEISNHGVSREILVRAVQTASDLADFSTILGTGCPDIVSTCALPALNLIRGALGRPPFQYDAELHARLCKEAKTSAVVTIQQPGAHLPDTDDEEGI